MGDVRIADPKTEVLIHVVEKTTQLGSVAGLAFAPIVIFRNRGLGLMRAIDKAGKVSTLLAATGAAAGVPMTMMRLSDKNEDEIFDRAYRLRFNQKVRRIDEYSFYGTLGGLAVGGLRFLTGSGVGLLAPLGYGVWGCASGSIAAIALPKLGYVLVHD